MVQIYSQLAYELENKSDIVVATIVADSGSAPRGAGAKMLIGERGRILGTIGGGAMEWKSEKMARELLREKRSLVHCFRLHKNDTEDLGMICGGDVTVLFQYVGHADAQWMALAAKLCEVSGQKDAVLCNPLDGSLPALFRGGVCVAGAPAQIEPALLSGGTVVCRDGYYIEPLPGGNRVILFGGGHISQALAPILPTIDFRPVVFDNRQEYANPGLFPDAEQVICGDFAHIGQSLSLTAEDYVVIMTNGHAHDFVVQEQVMRGPYAYLGVIGSRAKIASINKRLSENGFSAAQIAAVHTPIGVQIKSVTPAEIAISIAAELILVRAEKRTPQSVSCPMH